MVTLTVLVCTWVTTSDVCTEWSERHGTPNPPGSHETTADRRPVAVWTQYSLQRHSHTRPYVTMDRNVKNMAKCEK